MGQKMGRQAAQNGRMTRLRQALGADIDLRGHSIHSNRPLIAVTSSRLGNDPLLHRHVCQFLVRCLLDCRQREASLLIAAGSAIESWATRAAELLAVPIVVLSVDPDDESADILVTSRNTDAISRDAVVIALADRVDAVYVRRSGTVERCLRARIKTLCDASTRVAVCLSHQCAAPGLIAEGAIGWFHTSANSDRHTWDNSGKDHCLQEFDRHEHPQENCIWNVTDRWTRTDGRWLIHCTRQCDGAWPGETERQYRDSMILGDGSTLKRTALDTLIRILRSGQLVAGATAT